jgi:carbamoyltransferase
MKTLGINAAYHDSAAALVVDGTVVAAAEEERFTRIKHGKRPLPFTAWELPFHAIDYCLRAADLTLGQLDHVAYSYDPALFLGDQADQAMLHLPLQPSAHPATLLRTSAVHDGVPRNPWDALFAAYVVNAPRQLADGAPHHLKKRFAGGGPGDTPYRFHFVAHHTCHQASAFLAAPFDRCAVMTLDGRGERASTTYGRYRDNRYTPLGEVVVPHSLGLLYERITAHLGFLHSSDEYKVMALAALGAARYKDVLRKHVQVGRAGQYVVQPMDLAALFGPPRRPGTEMAAEHLDLAASLQDVLEDTVLELAGWLRESTGERRLALAGGVALNCVMNARLRDSGIFDEVWVQPAAGDAGTALGASMWIDARERGRLAGGDDLPQAAADAPAAGPLAPRRWQMSHAYLGPAYADEEVEALLQWARLDYRRVDHVAEAAADLLAAGRIIGWFQGRMEFGPRALGARSILASPIDPHMQTRLNELKDREDFRPVAPAVPVEDFADWFEPARANGGESPFMLFVYGVKRAKARAIPSACHTDGTARVQTVSAATNGPFHALLKAFGRRTGVPVLVNTSFNVRGEPIVCSPRAAIEAFFSTPLDALVIESFIVTKPRAGDGAHGG